MTLTVLPASQVSYTLEKSLRFRSNASARLSRTPAVAGNRQIWTWSGWVKRSTIGTYHTLFSTWQGTTTGAYSAIRFNVNGQIDIFDFTSTALTFVVATTAYLRDFSAWYHIVVAIDTTQAVASNRLKVYINGVQVTAFTTATYPTLNYQTYTNNNKITHIGASASLASGAASASTEFFDGYLTEINFISGLALDASYFGEISPVSNSWVPKKYTGIYGSTGFYLKFTDSTSLTSGSNIGLGKDFSGNDNYFNTTGISITTGATYDSVVDVPTLTNPTTSNYATLNSIATHASLTIQDAALTATSASTNVGCKSTISVTSGKWYWEAKIVTKNGANPIVGIVNTDRYWDYGYVGNLSSGWGYSGSGFKYTGAIGVAYGAVIALGDIVGVAFDLDAKTIEFYKNGVSQGVAFTSLPDGPYCPALSVQNNTISINFGQQPFTYSPPAGFNRLTSFNIADPIIKDPDLHMNTSVYTGTSSPQTIVNAGNFQPGLIWARSRTESAGSNAVNDSIRGPSKNLYTNLTIAENSTSYITSLNSNGFSVSGVAYIGLAPNSYVAWQWKTSLTSVTNNNGSLTSTVRANLTAGVSVVQFTLTANAVSTIGHGLNVAPKLIIVRGTNVVSNWLVYHDYFGPTKYILLNTTAGPAISAGAWNNTAPTSTIFTLGSSWNATYQMIAYCFSEVEGYSKIGAYTGNGVVNGEFVYTGFKPKFIFFRRADATVANWLIYDAERDPYNPTSNLQRPNLATADVSLVAIDFVSNGFKLRSTDAGLNAASVPYIYMAFAESPFKYSNAR